MVCKELPFAWTQGGDMIYRYPVKFPRTVPLSDCIKSMLRKMLRYDPAERPDAKSLLVEYSDYFQDVAESFAHLYNGSDSTKESPSEVEEVETAEDLDALFADDAENARHGDDTSRVDIPHEQAHMEVSQPSSSAKRASWATSTDWDDEDRRPAKRRNSVDTST